MINDTFSNNSYDTVGNIFSNGVIYSIYKINYYLIINYINYSIINKYKLSV